MSSSIAAITTGTGGVITTADNSGNLNLVSGTTTIVAVTSAGASVTGDLSATGITTVAAGTAALPAVVSATGTADTGLWFPAADTVAASTGGTERLRIDSSGNLLVNSTTSPSGSGNAFINGLVYIGTTNSDPTFNRVNGLHITIGGVLNTRANSTWDLGRDVTSGSHINFYTDNGSARVAAGSISSNGGTTSYNTTSDYRMKKNIAPMSGALTIIQALKPITYDWKDEFVGTKKSSQGFIAHELAEVFPDCVTGEKDAVDDEGKPQYQGIDTSFLVATLTAAIQELKAIIDTQAAQIAALNAKVGI